MVGIIKFFAHNVNFIFGLFLAFTTKKCYLFQNIQSKLLSNYLLVFVFLVVVVFGLVVDFFVVVVLAFGLLAVVVFGLVIVVFLVVVAIGFST
jgi:hypothetical protein